jgi:hypothetical protein
LRDVHGEIVSMSVMLVPFPEPAAANKPAAAAG